MSSTRSFDSADTSKEMESPLSIGDGSTGRRLTRGRWHIMQSGGIRDVVGGGPVSRVSRYFALMFVEPMENMSNPVVSNTALNVCEPPISKSLSA